MPTTKRLPENGTLVTVTLTDEAGTEHTFHGTLLETRDYVTEVTNWGGYDNYTRYPAEPALIDEAHPVETYARIYSATGNPMAKNGLAQASPDHFFTYAEIFVRVESANVTVRKATKEGQAWVEANLSLDIRRARLIEQIQALDPKLAEAVDRLIDDTHDAAFESGKDAEFRANDW